METFLLYEYATDGFHAGKVPLSDDSLETVLPGVVRTALAEGRTVILTDIDDRCILHVERGQIVFPTAQDIAEFGEEVSPPGVDSQT